MGFVTQGARGPEDVKSHSGLVQVGMSQAQQHRWFSGETAVACDVWLKGSSFCDDTKTDFK